MPTMLRTPAELRATLALDPFKGIKVTLDTRLCVAFLAEPLPDTVVLPHVSPGKDFNFLSATPGEAFVVLKLIDGSPGNLSGYIEKTFNIQAAVRFFSIAEQILEAAK